MPSLADYSSIAKEVFDTCLQVKSGAKVWIQSWEHTPDLAKALATECSIRGCPFLLSVRNSDVWLKSIMQGSKSQLERVAPQERALLEETDFYIYTMGPQSPVPWNSIPRDRRAEVSMWLDTRYDGSRYAKQWARIARANRVKMLAVEATIATPEWAKAQGLSPEDWREVLLQGCMVDHHAVAQSARKLARQISGKGRLCITTPAGTRLALNLDSRPVGMSDGISTNEMAEKGRVVFLPAGVIEVSVDEESANGVIVYGTPVRMGNRFVENLALKLKEGLIAHCSATQGLEAFEQYLRRGGRNAARLSYFGFGLNPNLRHGFGQDDKVLGGLTLGFGDNRSIGGKNQAKDQWWASMTGATVKRDDVTLMSEGKFAI